MPATIAHHAAGCRSTRTRATAAGRSFISREMPGPAAAQEPRGGARGKGVCKLSPFALATARARRVSPVKFQGWGGRYRRPPLGPFPGVGRRGAPVECCFRARGEKTGTSSSSLYSSSPGQALDVLTMPATIAHHAAGCRSTRTRATAAGKILDATRPAAELATWSGPRRAHHAAGCRSTRTRATAAGKILDATRPAAELVTWSGPRRCSPCRRRSLTTRPVVDRRGPGPRPREDPRRHAAGCRVGQALDVAHHAGDDRSPRGRAADRSGPGDTAAGKILDADQVTRFTTRRGRRQPGQALDVLTMPATIAHHAAGCRSTRTRATAAGRSSTRTR
jgi:hypothetical protein